MRLCSLRFWIGLDWIGYTNLERKPTAPSSSCPRTWAPSSAPSKSPSSPGRPPSGSTPPRPPSPSSSPSSSPTRPTTTDAFPQRSNRPAAAAYQAVSWASHSSARGTSATRSGKHVCAPSKSCSSRPCSWQRRTTCSPSRGSSGSTPRCRFS